MYFTSDSDQTAQHMAGRAISDLVEKFEEVTPDSFADEFVAEHLLTMERKVNEHGMPVRRYAAHGDWENDPQPPVGSLSGRWVVGEGFVPSAITEMIDSPAAVAQRERRDAEIAIAGARILNVRNIDGSAITYESVAGPARVSAADALRRAYLSIKAIAAPGDAAGQRMRNAALAMIEAAADAARVEL